MGAGVAEPLGLGGEAAHGLHHREGDQFGIAQAGSDPDLRTPRRQAGMLLQQVIRRRVVCGREGV